jgi:hypothetical protein
MKNAPSGKDLSQHSPSIGLMHAEGKSKEVKTTEMIDEGLAEE